MRLGIWIALTLAVFLTGVWVGVRGTDRYCVTVKTNEFGAIPYCSPTPIPHPDATM